jgi:hypothetical protein
MSATISLTDSHALSDLQVFLARAARVEDGSVRLIATDFVLLVYSAILYRRGLLDSSPTVLGLRTFALTEPVVLDTVVTVRAVLDRIAHLPVVDRVTDAPVPVPVPFETTTVSWAGISPPRSGWESRGQAHGVDLEAAARAGIDEVAAAIPAGTGEQIVQRVRSEIWGRPLEGLDDLSGVPAGAAFAAFSLGFLSVDEPVRVFQAGSWLRLSTSRGHVLVKS